MAQAAWPDWQPPGLAVPEVHREGLSQHQLLALHARARGWAGLRACAATLQLVLLLFGSPAVALLL